MRTPRSHLKVRARMERNGKWIGWNPGNVQIMLNDVPLDLVNSLSISFGLDEPPQCTLKMTLTELDMDVDTLLALAAAAKIEPQLIERMLWEAAPAQSLIDRGVQVRGVPRDPEIVFVPGPDPLPLDVALATAAGAAAIGIAFVAALFGWAL